MPLGTDSGAILESPAGRNASPKRRFVKELSVLDLKAPASPVLSKGERKIIATTRFGKGRVFAVGDPWLYNEYTDGRKIPAVYENFIAGKDLANWLLQ